MRQKNKFKDTLQIGNTALKHTCKLTTPDLTELNQLIYATAKVLQSKCGIRCKKKKPRLTPHKKPRWKLKIEKEIETMRSEISILEELQKNKDVRTGKACKVKRKYKLENKDQIPSIIEELKQRIQVKAQTPSSFPKTH